MSVRLWGLIVAVAFVCGGVTPVEANSKYVFPTKPEVSIKLVKALNGRPVRGKLISLTSREAVVDTGSLSKRDRDRGELGQRIGFDRMESFRSTDGRLEFTPDESFQAIAQRISRAYPSVDVVVDPDAGGSASIDESEKPPAPETRPMPPDRPNPPRGKPPRPESSETEPPPRPRPESGRPGPGKPKGVGNGGFGGVKNLQKPRRNDPGSLAHNADPGPGNNPGSNDGHRTPPEREPSHPSNESPNTANTNNNPNNPFAPTGPATPAAGSTPTTDQAVPPVGVPSTTTTVQGSGFSFDTIPMWGKAGIFVGFLLLAYRLVF